MTRGKPGAIGLAGLVVVAVVGCTPAGPSAATSPVSTAAPETAAASPRSTAEAMAPIGELQAVARMSTPRAVATATRLADGRILVAGGCANAGCDLGTPGGATAEIFDPATGSFARTGDLTISRDDHIAVALADGRVMLIGGWAASGILATTDIYDPSTGKFTPGSTMASGRAGALPVALADGRILIAGGFVGAKPTIRAAEILDPTNATFAPTGDLTEARGAYAAARMPDGRVLIAGGLDNGAVTATAELYDAASGTFSPTGSMSLPRYKGGALAMADGRVLVFGGAADIDGETTYDSSEIFDPATGTFSPGPRLQHSRYKLAESTIVLGDGIILISGGAPEPEVFDLATGRFAPISGSLGATRLFLAAAAIDAQRALLVGGYDRVIRPTDEAWIYTRSP